MAGRLVVELESIHLTSKKPYFKDVKAFAVLQYKNEERRGQRRKLPGMDSHWGETFDFDVEGNPKADCVWTDVYKEKKMFDKKIGTCKILLYDAIAQRGEPSRATFPLTSDSKTEDDSNIGHMAVLLRYYPSNPQLEAALEKAEERVRKLERELQLKLEHQRIGSVEAAASAGIAAAAGTLDSLTATISKVEQLRLQAQVRRLENEIKWEENDARWAENHGKWAANDIKWAENDIKWVENETKSSQIQVKQNSSILEMCITILKADLSNLRYHLTMLVVGIRTWFTS